MSRRFLWILGMCIGLCFLCEDIAAQTPNAIDAKGTKVPINWTVNGTDIHNNNTGNVGIGTPTPGNLLEISQGTPGNSGLRFTNLTNASLLATDANGDLITANPLAGTIAAGNYLGYDTSGNLVLGGAGGGNFWSLAGNSNATAASILGTTNDVKLALYSNNTPMLEVGRRQTLGLFNTVGNLFPYNQANNSVAFIRGTGGVSALEFESSGAAFYKPTLFTDADGNFLMRGSSAQTDFFELGSAGAANNGSLLFTIGDDGNEPIIFRKYNWTDQTYVEMMRLQGIGLDGLGGFVRAGINVNGNTPNSTLQVNGSTSTAIFTTTAGITLDETHHTVILGGNHTLTLPPAADCQGRMYIIKNPNNNATIISNYLNASGNSVATVNDNSVLWVQSDGTNWQQISETEQLYEKIVIWAEEGNNIDNGALEWSYGNGDTNFIGIPLPEDWEAYAVSCHIDNTVNAAGEAVIAVGDIAGNNTFNELLRFTATGGTTDNLVYHQILATPVNVPAGTTIGFRTISRNQNLNSARVAVWLRRRP